MSSSRLDNHDSSVLLNNVKRIFLDYEHRDLTTEKMSQLTEKLYQIWTRHGENQAFRVIDYLEELIVKQKIKDQFLILIVSTLSKNSHFYQQLLNDHQRFQSIFKSMSSCLMRYVELLYFYCPPSLIETSALQFYRFIVDQHCLVYLRRRTRDIDWLAAFSTLLYHFYENLSKHLQSSPEIFSSPKDALDYSMVVIDTFLHHRLKTHLVQDLIYDLKLINTIIKVIHLLWQENHPLKRSDQFSSIQLQSIEYLFMEISNSKEKISPTILAIFSRVHLEAAEITVKTMFADGRLTGQRLAVIIQSLIQLIDSPIQLMQSMSYEIWITGLCTALINFHQHDYLREVIDQTNSFLVDHLFYERTADNAIQILFWFIRYDKRVETVRCLFDRLPKLFERFQLHSNEDLQTKSIELCHMALAIHSDSNLKDHPFIKEILQKFPHPDLNVLSNHRYIHAKFHSMPAENDLPMRNRVGIINLGNTCYVNSVLQALYQCDLFRQYLLEHDFQQQNVLRELQLIFAQLNLSKRPFINAINLVKIARPPWFTSNEQQDCAEFLGYLLDTIKDEEKKHSSISASHETERLFTIRTSQINRCQRCSRESSREESSNYLFLPIPTVDSPAETINYNQSATSSFISILHNGLKFYAATNRNSNSEEQAKTIAETLVSSPPPSYSTLVQTNEALNLQSIFDRYFQNEELKDENQYRCEYCRSLQDAERYTILQTAPEYLILSLNRFEYDKRTNIFRKVFTKITYPKVLNVHVHPSTLTKYCLVLVIVHTGYTLHGGHYYVYAREVKPTSPSHNNTDETIDDYFSNDEWFLMNDDLVTLSSYEALIENCAQYTSATPYVLFYKRVDQQRIEAMKQTVPLRIHNSLIEQIDQDNQIYKQEQEK